MAQLSTRMMKISLRYILCVCSLMVDMIWNLFRWASELFDLNLFAAANMAQFVVAVIWYLEGKGLNSLKARIYSDFSLFNFLLCSTSVRISLIFVDLLIQICKIVGFYQYPPLLKNAKIFLHIQYWHFLYSIGFTGFCNLLWHGNPEYCYVWKCQQSYGKTESCTGGKNCLLTSSGFQ